ncbi:hypothetical protein CISIN_1g0386392mg, partial [Citrus sinensis]
MLAPNKPLYSTDPTSIELLNTQVALYPKCSHNSNRLWPFLFVSSPTITKTQTRTRTHDAKPQFETFDSNNNDYFKPI